MLSYFCVCWIGSITVLQPLYSPYEQVAVSHAAEVLFSLALQNRNVGHGGVSPHFGPPAQQQIRERSHQYRELFVLFIKNWRLFL